MKRIHLIVSGRVQGVFFRAETKQAASSLGLTGWIKNNLDGRVEICAEGDEEHLNNLVDWVHHGPSLADVTNVSVNWEAATGEFKSFDITR